MFINIKIKFNNTKIFDNDYANLEEQLIMQFVKFRKCLVAGLNLLSTIVWHYDMQREYYFGIGL